MSYKRLFFTLLCLGLNSVPFLTLKANTENNCDLLRKKLSVFERPENDPVDVLFFDINHDGIPDALVSERFDKSFGGNHGNLWYLYRFENGEWQYKFKKIDEDIDGYNNVYARGDDFYSLTMDGQKPKLVLVYTSHNNEGYGWLQDDSAHEITIDEDGYLKAIPIPELTTQYLSPYEGSELPPFDVLPPHLKNIVTNIPSQASIEMGKLLVPLSIESFYPQKKNEDGKSPPVATAGKEDVAQVSPSNHEGEEKLGMRNEELGIEKEGANRLWLYAGVVFLLATAFYFLRKRFSKN